MKAELEEYRYLWDSSNLESNWVLLKAPLPGGYCVFDKQNHILLHIEIAEINEAVCKEMKDRGCEILEKMPRESPTPPWW